MLRWHNNVYYHLMKLLMLRVHIHIRFIGYLPCNIGGCKHLCSIRFKLHNRKPCTYLSHTYTASDGKLGEGLGTRLGLLTHYTLVCKCSGEKACMGMQVTVKMCELNEEQRTLHCDHYSPLYNHGVALAKQIL